MKLSASIDGLAALARINCAPLVARIQVELDRELQVSAAPAAPPLDPATRRAALERALRRLER